MRSRLTYANVMATVAVFLALGGVSYAAFKLPKNSVGAKQLKAGAVTGAKIKNGAVTGAKIAKGSITGAGIELGSLGTVPSASRAASAARAETATTAASAQTLQGMTASQISGAAKLSCPAGTTLFNGLCYEQQRREAAQWLPAVRTCAKEGRRLPSAGEIGAFGVAADLRGTEWTSDLYSDGLNYFAITLLVYATGFQFGGEMIGTPQVYRCVAPPTN